MFESWPFVETHDYHAYPPPHTVKHVESLLMLHPPAFAAHHTSTAIADLLEQFDLFLTLVMTLKAIKTVIERVGES